MHPPPLRKKTPLKKVFISTPTISMIWYKACLDKINLLFVHMHTFPFDIYTFRCFRQFIFFSHHRRLFSVVYDIPSFFVPNRTSFLFWAHWKQMMIMVGCDHYDEPFNLVNNDNPDYLKISRACCTGTMSAGGPDIQRVSRIIRGGQRIVVWRASWRWCCYTVDGTGMVWLGGGAGGTVVCCAQIGLTRIPSCGRGHPGLPLRCRNLKKEKCRDFCFNPHCTVEWSCPPREGCLTFLTS